MDKYGILCIFNLVLHSIWHSFISILIYETTADFRVPKNSTIANLDRGAFALFGVFFIVLHIFLVAWLFCVPLKHRQRMKEKDHQYRAMILKSTTGISNRSYSTTEKETVSDRHRQNQDFTMI